MSDELHLYELNNIRLNPLYKKYKLLIKLAINIIKLRRYKDSNKENSAPPFYIDMSLLFEKYVYALLIDSLKGKAKILYQKVYNYGLKPDFIIKNNKYNCIADSKYKTIYDNNINIEDIRQLSGYGRVKSIIEEFTNDNNNYVPSCLIIYPSENSNNTNIDFEKKEEIDDLVNFEKLSIKLPTLN